LRTFGNEVLELQYSGGSIEFVVRVEFRMVFVSRVKHGRRRRISSFKGRVNLRPRLKLEEGGLRRTRGMRVRAIFSQFEVVVPS
jgi:hypothetical protein